MSLLPARVPPRQESTVREKAALSERFLSQKARAPGRGEGRGVRWEPQVQGDLREPQREEGAMRMGLWHLGEQDTRRCLQPETRLSASA